MKNQNSYDKRALGSFSKQAPLIHRFNKLIRSGVLFAGLLCAWVPAVADPELYFVHNDHLSTPQMLTDKDGNVVWQVESQTPFGVVDTNEDVDGDGQAIEFNLRFPGQYYDTETGLSYNYFRDYDPLLGRYIQSDPIGLGGGINTYGYVYQNPTRYVDPTGEAVALVLNPVSIGLILIGGCAATNCLSSIGIQENPNDMSRWDDHLSDDEKQQKDWEYDRYKYQCNAWNSPPPQFDSCQARRWRIKQLERCINMRKSWDRKWNYAGALLSHRIENKKA